MLRLAGDFIRLRVYGETVRSHCSSKPRADRLTATCSFNPSRRWPTILTGIIDELARLNGGLLGEESKDKVKESKDLIGNLGGLIYEMRHDRELPLLPGGWSRGRQEGQTDLSSAVTGLPDDIEEYNAEILAAREAGQPMKWFNASWLYAECYMCV